MCAITLPIVKQMQFHYFGFCLIWTLSEQGFYFSTEECMLGKSVFLSFYITWKQIFEFSILLQIHSAKFQREENKLLLTVTSQTTKCFPRTDSIEFSKQSTRQLFLLPHYRLRKLKLKEAACSKVTDLRNITANTEAQVCTAAKSLLLHLTE